MNPRPLRVLDLFSGIGGFSIGLERAGMKTVAFCEIDPFCRKVLAKHWPEVPIYEDIRELTASVLERDGIGRPSVLAGGFPCQDVSRSGKKAGIQGSRSSLWAEYARIVGELRPQYVLVENVTGLLDGGMGTVLGDLAALGYDAEWECFPASALGAPHRRDRVWIIAYPAGIGQPEPGYIRKNSRSWAACSEWKTTDAVDALRRGTVPVLCREHDGVSHRMERLTALGNAIVPAAAELLGRSIMQVHYD